MVIGAYGGLWMLTDGYWCLWRPMDANRWLLVPMETYGCYGWLLVPMEVYRWLLVPIEAYGCYEWLLVPMEAYGC